MLWYAKDLTNQQGTHRCSGPGMKLSKLWNTPAIVLSSDGRWLIGGGTSRKIQICWI